MPMPALRFARPALLPLVALAAGLSLAACSMGGGGASSSIALAPGLSARMDQPGASLDRAQAIGIINAYRATQGIPALTPDAGLDGTAQVLANQYARPVPRPRRRRSSRA